MSDFDSIEEMADAILGAQETLMSCLAFLTYRDLMNAELHADTTRYSPLTVMVAERLIAIGETDHPLIDQVLVAAGAMANPLTDQVLDQ